MCVVQVGEGLSRLFSCSGFESAAVAGVSKTLANTMGLFLQKTNIIRDYLEGEERERERFVCGREKAGANMR